MTGRLLRLVGRRGPGRDMQRRSMAETVTIIRSALDGKRSDRRPRPGAPESDDRPRPAPEISAEDRARFKLDQWLDQHQTLDPEQRSALLSSAFLMLEETKALIAESRSQLEAARRSAAVDRAAYEHRMREGAEERRRYQSEWEAERRRLLNALKAEQAAGAELREELTRQRERSGEDVEDARRTAAELRQALERHRGQAEIELKTAKSDADLLRLELERQRERINLDVEAAVKSKEAMARELETERERFLVNTESNTTERASLIRELEEARGAVSTARSEQERLSAERAAAQERLRLVQSKANEGIDRLKRALAAMRDELERERERAQADHISHEEAVELLQSQLTLQSAHQHELARAREAMAEQAGLLRILMAERETAGVSEPAPLEPTRETDEYMELAAAVLAGESEPQVPEYEVDLSEESLHEASSGKPEALAEPGLTVPERMPERLPDCVNAMLRMDGVGHLHDCIEVGEINELVAELHHVEWIASQRVAMSEADGHPELSDVGMPMAEFLFGVLPKYVLGVTIGWAGEWADRSFADADPEDPEKCRLELGKLLQFHDILTRLAAHAFERRAILIESGPTDFSVGGPGARSEIEGDALGILASIYEEVAEVAELAATHGVGEEDVLAGLQAAVAPCAWRRLDGAPVSPETRAKLLYLISRAVYSFQLCVVEAFSRGTRCG